MCRYSRKDKIIVASDFDFPPVVIMQMERAAVAARSEREKNANARVIREPKKAPQVGQCSKLL